MEERLERWRYALDRRGIKVNKSEAEQMFVNEKENGGMVNIQDVEGVKVD